LGYLGNYDLSSFRTGLSTVEESPMHHRTDAAGRAWIVASFVLFAAGCAPLAWREASRETPVVASPPAALPNAPALAITTPPAPAGDVKPAALQLPQPPQTPVAERPSGAGYPAGSPSQPADSDPVRRLQRDAAAAYAKLPCYIARLRRREVVMGRAKPEEVLIFKFRERPYSVHFKWLGEEGKGREVIYVRGQFDSKLHILTAANDIPFTPAGRRLALAPDSMMVRAASKYPITEAGIGNMIARFGRLLDAVQAGGSGVSVKFLGPVQRPEYATPLEGVECMFPAGREPEIPDGGRRLVYFDPATHFPVLSLTYDQSGHEVDFYCFDRFQLDVKLDDDDFNPDKLWGAVGQKK
jgi:Protein of unknown function (DUF1571)